MVSEQLGWTALLIGGPSGTGKSTVAEIWPDLRLIVHGGTSFGPLHGRIWRIGTMGESATLRNVTLLLGALKTILGE